MALIGVDPKDLTHSILSPSGRMYNRQILLLKSFREVFSVIAESELR
jgi:hypothetical protein